MASIAELLFANGLQGASPLGAPLNAALTGATPAAQTGGDFMALLQQLFAAAPTQLAAQQFAMPVPIEGAPPVATPGLLDPSAQPSPEASELLGALNNLSQNRSAINSADDAKPTGAPALEGWLLSTQMAVQSDFTMQQSGTSASQDEVLSAQQAMPVSTEMLPLSDAGPVAVVNFIPQQTPEGATPGQSYQLLIPLSQIQQSDTAPSTLQVALVSQEDAAKGANESVVLPATLEVTDSQSAKLSQLLLKAQAAATDQSQNQSQTEIAADETQSLSTVPTEEPQTLVSARQPMAMRSNPIQQIIPPSQPNAEPVLVSVKLTLDSKALDQLLTQAVQASTTEAARPTAPAQTAPAAQPTPLLQTQDSKQTLIQTATSAAQLVAATADSSGSSLEFSDDAPEQFTNLPRQPQQPLPVHGQTFSLQSSAVEAATPQVEHVARTHDIEQLDKMRLHFSQAQLRSLLHRGEIRMQLTPPELGDMRVEVKSDADKMTARFELRTEAARQIVEQNLPHLRDSLSRVGLRVDSFEVVVNGDRQQHMQQGLPQNAAQQAPVEVPDNAPDAEENEPARLVHLGRVNLIA